MSRRSFVGLFTIILIIISSSASIWNASAMVESISESSNEINQDVDVEQAIFAPGTINMTQLNLYDYYDTISSGHRFHWKITDLERTENFHISEGDKKLKQGDRINLIMGGDPWLQRTEPHSWAQVYVNDVMARFDTDAETGQAIYKFIQPLGIDLVETFTSAEFNYTANYTAMGNDGYFNYLENSPFYNQSQYGYWTFESNIVTYQNTIISDISNVTDITLIYERSTGFLNEMYYSASFTNSTGSFAGANLTLIRLHGWGLPYYITTWVVWIPIILVLVGLIVAIRFQAFQRLKLYFEARKLARRD
jgi:hypothetical protein